MTVLLKYLKTKQYVSGRAPPRPLTWATSPSRASSTLSWEMWSAGPRVDRRSAMGSRPRCQSCVTPYVSSSCFRRQHCPALRFWAASVRFTSHLGYPQFCTLGSSPSRRKCCLERDPDLGPSVWICRKSHDQYDTWPPEKQPRTLMQSTSSLFPGSTWVQFGRSRSGVLVPTRGRFMA